MLGGIVAAMSRKRGSGTDDPRWQSQIRPAPGDLRVVQALVNTAGIGSHAEELSSPRALADWLRRWKLLDRRSELAPADPGQMRRVRSALRSLIHANHGPEPAPETLEILDRAATAAPLHVRFVGGPRFEPSGDGLAEALARLFEIAALAHHVGRWQRLKLCARDGCGAAFYDFSNARSAKWCSARCGDRGSSRTYRKRLKRYKARERAGRP